MDGFARLIERIAEDCGLSKSYIHTNKTALPGFFRATKEWDLVIADEEELVAVIEFKAQVGSFGNNFNNRIEEALGSSIDLLTAYREGVFKPSQRPWLGWLMLLEDHPNAKAPVRIRDAHFKVRSEFENTSYAERYRLFCTKLIRERVYDAACLILSNADYGIGGKYREIDPEVSFKAFATCLRAKLFAHVSTGSPR